MLRVRKHFFSAHLTGLKADSLTRPLKNKHVTRDDKKVEKILDVVNATIGSA